MSSHIQDLPRGPLDVYRKRASFDWKKLKLFLDGEDTILYQAGFYNELKTRPDLIPKYKHDSLDEERRIEMEATRYLSRLKEVSPEYLFINLNRVADATKVLVMWRGNMAVSMSIARSLVTNTILFTGTEKHRKILKDIELANIFVAFCLTEVGHGSNVKGMRCTATYDKKSKDFVFNTPNFESAKCWAGNIANKAIYAIVFAQLLIDGKSYNLHSFLVPIRDPKTHLPYPGVTITDMGTKIGLNGIDNGILMFNNYHVPRDCLLNRLADVTEDGIYQTPHKNSKKRQSSSLGALSGGRIGVALCCYSLGIKAMTVAIRYSAVRKQFGPENEEEVAIIEYQTQQYKLFPYLAALYAFQIFAKSVFYTYNKFTMDLMFDSKKEGLGEMSTEIHGLSCAIKAFVSWTVRDGIQECREACGGHGYLSVAGIGDVRNDHDANLTYEGENLMIIQQTGRWLLTFWPLIQNRSKISTPLGSVDFFNNALDILQNSKFTSKTVDEVCQPKNILNAYQWLTIYLLKNTYEKLEDQLASGKNSFWCHNDNQVFYAKNLASAYIQHYCFHIMLAKIEEATDPGVKNALLKLFSLFSLWLLEKQLHYFYQGGYANGSEPTTLIQTAILTLCSELKNEAVALVDAITAPDFIINSALGCSDGEVYKHLQEATLQNPNTRPAWWPDITNQHVKNKL